MSGNEKVSSSFGKCLVKTAKTLFADFVLHSTSLYEESDHAIADAVLFASRDQGFLWMLSNSKSEWMPRQFCASILHFSRFCFSWSLSSSDIFASYGLSYLFPQTSYFKPEHAKLRRFRRMMLTLKRNGGVYKDMFDIARTFCTVLTPYGPFFNQSPLYGNAASENIIFRNNYSFSKNQAIHLISKELGSYNASQIEYISKEDSFQTHSVQHFRGRLTTGEAVTISILPPNTRRMMWLDLLPFKVVRFVMSPFPFCRPEYNLLSYFVNRLDFDMKKEAQKRLELLSLFGVSNCTNPMDLFIQARSIDFPLYVPAPIKNLTSKHIMVTDYNEAPMPMFGKFKATSQIFKAAGVLLSKNCIISDLSPKNVRVTNGTITLDRFVSFGRLQAQDVNSFLIHISELNHLQKPSCISRHIGIPEIEANKFDDSIGFNEWKFVRNVGRKSPNTVRISEMLCSLTEHGIGLGQMSFSSIRNSFFTTIKDFFK